MIPDPALTLRACGAIRVDVATNDEQLKDHVLGDIDSWRRTQAKVSTSIRHEDAWTGGSPGYSVMGSNRIRTRSGRTMTTAPVTRLSSISSRHPTGDRLAVRAGAASDGKSRCLAQGDDPAQVAHRSRCRLKRVPACPARPQPKPAHRRRRAGRDHRHGGRRDPPV
jgi:hypothetical protein